MKKMCAFLTVCVLAVLLSACGKKEAGLKATVTVSTAGKLQLAAKEVTVKDSNGDGAYTVLEAIESAHSQYGSSDKPFKAVDSDFGKSITSVWGDENGLSGYGVYLNNEMCYDLSSPVAEGAYVAVYSYKDLETWSDAYAFFDTLKSEAADGKVTLSLSVMTLDADWNPVKSPLAGAKITVDGAETEFVTDESGKVTLTLSGKGEKLISAEADNYIMIPPVCIVTVK